MRGKLFLINAYALLIMGACTREVGMEIPGVQEMEFRAVWADADETRTSLQPDGTSIWWSPGDQINVFYGGLFSGQFTSTNAEAQPLVNFRGSLVAQTGTEDSSVSGLSYWAIYPYNKNNSCDSESVEMTLLTFQEAVSGTFSEGSFPAVAKSEGLDLAFYNVCGGARFSVANEGVRRVVFKANAGESLCGKIRVAFGDDGKPFVKEVIEGVDSVVVEGPSGGFVPGTYYYAAILPQTLSQGMKMVFRKEQESASLVMNNSISVNRSRFGILDRKDQSLSFTPGGGVGPRPWYEEAPSDLVTVHNPSRGGLEDVLLDWGDYEKIKSLKVIGTMNDVDFLVIYRDMPNLRYLDISDIDNTTIPTKAFYESKNVTHLILPKDLTEIGEEQFCKSSLVAVKLMDSLKTIGIGAFYYCKALTSISIPSSVKSIKNYAFRYCSAFLSVTFEQQSQLKLIGPGAFGNTPISEIVIPASVESLGSSSFWGCTALASVAFERNSCLKSIGGGYNYTGSSYVGSGAFTGCTSLRSIEIPANVEVIGPAAFMGCTALASVTFEKNAHLKTIDGTYYYSNYFGAFSNCTSLSSLVLPSSVETIGVAAFKGCSSLTAVSFEKDAHLKTIKGGYYYWSNSKGEVISEDYGAFSDCALLATVALPASLETIGQTAFKNCTALTSVVFEENSNLKTIEGGAKGSRFYGAFTGCSSLASIVIPASVETIGTAAFKGCRVLTTVSFGRNSQLRSIRGGCAGSVYYGAFSDCSSLRSIEIPARVDSIGIAAFKNCTSLKSVVFEENSCLIDLGSAPYDYGVCHGAFSGCVSLSSIKIPAGVSTLRGGLFQGCTALTKVSFEEDSQLTRIITDNFTYDYSKSSAFSGCSSLKTIDATNCSKLESIDNYTFFQLGTLRLFYCGSETPPTVDMNTFTGIDPYAVLKVPDNCVDAYKASKYWKNAFPQISGFNE